MIYILIFTSSLFIILSMLSCKFNKTSMLNGLLILLSAFAIIANLGYLNTQIDITLIKIPVGITLIMSISIILLCYLLSIIILIFDGIIVWYYEKHYLANIFSLVCGLLMLIYPIINNFVFNIFPNPIGLIIERAIEYGLLYIVTSFIIFSISVIICNLNKPKLDQDYIIILGAGLVNGNKIGSILASRIDKAINIYQRQIKYNNKHPFIICSGGQGPDETIPEGIAMCKYAKKHGVNKADITAEVKSINTMTNFKLSKKIINQTHLKIDNGIFVSSNYHIYRANRYAKVSGLPINGVGSKTKISALSNSILREYFAIMLNHKLLNLFIGILIVIITNIIYI